MPVIVDEPNVIDVPVAVAPKLVPWTVMIVAVDDIQTKNEEHIRESTDT